MEQLLSFILGAVIFFYLLSKVGGFLLRFFINRKLNQFSNGAGAGRGFSGSTGNGANQNSNPFWGNRQNSQNDKQHKEGEIFISRNNSSQKRVKDKVGEYVDFEEIKGEF